jgi:hypothetical protein
MSATARLLSGGHALHANDPLLDILYVGFGGEIPA